MQITTSVSATTAGSRARKGAAWLDIKRPGWHEQIDLARLDIGSGSDCVVAQLNNGSFGRGITKMDPDWNLDLRAHGFMGTSVLDDRALNAAWREVILRRLHGERPAPASRLRAFLRRVLPFAA